MVVTGHAPFSPFEGERSLHQTQGGSESYASSFDDLFNKRNQRDTFRRYLEGLLLPSERNKTLTGLANTEPVAGATHKDAQKLQWFLSESTWDPALVNNKRLALLSEDEHSKPNPEGALVIDETGDRKWGRHTAHVGRQYLGSIGKIDNGVVSVHTLWANEERYYPIEVEPYTPAPWFALGKNDPEFRSKPQIALELIENAHALGIPFRAVVADRFYGENHPFWTTLQSEEIPYVLALNPSHAWWHQIGTIGSAEGVAGAASWREDDAGVWEKLTRCFRDGHQETWWALEGVAGPYGPESAKRLIIVTTDPAALPEESTFYLRTNLPAPGSSRAQESGMIPADVAEIVRLYGLRVWVEQSYKQVKGSLGWAQYQVRSDMAMRRHWQLVCCAFSFCWWALPGGGVAAELDGGGQPVSLVEGDVEERAGGKKKEPESGRDLATGVEAGQSLAGTLPFATAGCGMSDVVAC